MPAVTDQQLEDASRDADDLARIVNEAADYNGNGQVPTRYGASKRTIARVIADIAEEDIGEGAAALINQRLNRYQVSFLDPIEVNIAGGTVRYGRFIIGREGETFKSVSPADYGLTYFQLPLAAPSIAEEHYIDVAMIAPAQTSASPIKKVTGGNFVQADLTKVPLALSYAGNFQPLWGGVVKGVDKAEKPETLVFQNGDPFYDGNNFWGGGIRSLYLPTQAGSDDTGITGAAYNVVTGAFITITNPESSARRGYCRLAFPDDAQVYVAAVTRSTGLASMINYTDLPAVAKDVVLLGVMWTAGAPQFFVPVRNVDDRVGRNLFPAGKTMDDPSIDVFGDAGAGALEAITDEGLLALGFTKGRRGAVGGRIVVGMGQMSAVVPRGVRGTVGFNRFAVQVSANNAFPKLGDIYVWDATSNYRVRFAMERKVSDRAAIYSGPVGMNIDLLDHFYAGVDMTGLPAYAIVTGMQFTASPAGALGIARTDYPATAGGGSVPFNAAYAPVMFVNKGRPLPLYPGNIIKDKRADYGAKVSLWAGGADGHKQPFERQGRDQIIVDPATIDNGMTGALDFLLPNMPDRRYRLPIYYAVGPANGGGAVRRIAILGDSITNREAPIRTAQILESLGYAVTCIGTMNNSGGGTNSAPAFGGEGREGHEFADYIYEHTDAEVPLPVGEEVSYRGNDDGYKLNRNPFIRLATGADAAQYVFNGYTFDYRFYLDRFGFPDPTHVIVNLGRNDVSQADPATTLAQVARGYRVMRDRIRQALPNAYIGFAKYGEATSNGALTDWDTDQWNIITKLLTLIRADVAGGDGRLFFLPAYAHMSQEGGGWALNLDSTDADSGMRTMTVADYVHPDAAVRQQFAEVYAGFAGALAP